jgi:hypothetical protein
MIRVIMGMREYDDYWTRDFNLPELETFITQDGREESGRNFIGIEVIPDVKQEAESNG